MRKGKRFLVACSLALLIFVGTVQAVVIEDPAEANNIVVVDVIEQNVDVEKRDSGDIHKYHARCRIVAVEKGELEVGREIEVDYTQVVNNRMISGSGQRDRLDEGQRARLIMDKMRPLLPMGVQPVSDQVVVEVLEQSVQVDKNEVREKSNYVARCKVVEALYGDLKVGQEMTIEYEHYESKEGFGPNWRGQSVPLKEGGKGRLLLYREKSGRFVPLGPDGIQPD